ncbi:sodium:proton antiporter [uncultured Acetobacteroides sp.]|uniref:sodium:proton antiporter n=1 Tax=uncultured Acetobacteroides sp. TaxID=1760811 RepID=UPI0029F58927|nr:sodium:proton antiporter [uncultured Acetobacteroides sp.]
MTHSIFHPLDGATLSTIWALPFLGIILSIALLPLFAPNFWSKHYGKVSLFWALLVIVGVGALKGVGISLHTVAQVMFEQFLPFIFLLLALYTITGGIKIRGSLKGTPKFNTLMLALGGLLSSWLGTTGAAVLFIRPLLKANQHRHNKVHTIIFFIFIVGNIGGTLTPVGNPPLLMGYISKIPFFWTLTNMFLPTLLTTGILLALYYCIDLYYFKKQKSHMHDADFVHMGIEGALNLVLLLFAIAAVVISSQDLGIAFTLFGVEVNNAVVIELAMLALLAWVSMKVTATEIREYNNFTWHPILEVGKLFAGIFITMAPLIAILRAGETGAMGGLIGSLTHADGTPANGFFYWASGMLSAFLDSAPAYLVFFNIAAAPAESFNILSQTYMIENIPQTLIAITMGASFMGALSYIGNAPNMMIKAIAEENGVKMPSFFGYMLWSFGILIPIFLLMQWIFL